MTVSSTTSRNEYSGNAVTTTFSYTFRILDEDHISVYVDDVLLTLTTDYTVTDVGVSGGGSIEFVSAPASGTGNVVFVRDVPLTQETDYVENDPFPAEAHEDALDKLTMIAQQLDSNYLGVLRVPVVEGDIGDLPAAASRASKYLAFDAGGLPVMSAGTTSAYVVTPFMETVLDDATAADARTTLGAQTYDAQLDTWSGVTPGTGVATALAVNIGSAGAPVVFNGALGTPASGNLSNCTGAPAAVGSVVQVVEATPYVAYGSSATTIPYDDTIPQNTEGAEWNTVTITPTSATNRLRIEVDYGSIFASASDNIIGAIFQDSTASALAAAVTLGNNYAESLRIVHEMAAGTTSATTFKTRAGLGSGTIYINGAGATRILGGVSAVRMRVTEIKV